MFASEIVVLKFGGSSLASDDQLQHAARYVARTHRPGCAVVVVVSARGKTTDELLELAERVSASDCADVAREIDQLLSTGESASAALMAIAVTRAGAPAVSLTGAQAGIRVTGRHRAGVIAAVDTQVIHRHLSANKVVVVGGFQGADDDGNVLTLGRGGSDTTAVALAAALDARLCVIYTDVDGIYTADPRLVPTARRLPEVDARMMTEMAFSGAKVLHSRSVELAASQRVALHVRKSGSTNAGSLVTSRGVERELETANAVVAITHDFDTARVLVQSSRDLAADVLVRLAGNTLPVDLVARSGLHEDEFRMGFTVRRCELSQVEAVLRPLLTDGGQLRIDQDVAKVSLIGMGLLNRPEYVARMVAALAAARIATSWIWTSQLRVSVIVPITRGPEAVSALHSEFDLERDELGLGSLATA